VSAVASCDGKQRRKSGVGISTIFGDYLNSLPIPHRSAPSSTSNPHQKSSTGADILSSYPTSKSSATGATAAYLAYGAVSLNTAPAAYYSGLGTLKDSPLADCGNGINPCPAAKDAACMVQIKAREQQLEDGSVGNVMPSACSMVKFCVDNGAKAVVLVPPEATEYGPFPKDVSWVLV